MRLVMMDEAGRLVHAAEGPQFLKSFGQQPQKPQQGGASPQPAPAGDEEHPSVVGKGDFGGAHPGKADKMSFGGKQYNATGKAGNSLHDKTPVREFQADDGHKVWGDEAGRVHANSKGEVESLRQRAQGGGAPGSPPGGAASPQSGPQGQQQPQQGQPPQQGAESAPQAQQGGQQPPGGAHALTNISSKTLGQATKGKIDLNKRAKAELASRGQDSSGQWVGVAKAKAHHGVSDADMHADPDDEVAGQFKNIPSEALGAAARGETNLNEHAKQVLADRGHDGDGNWVGFGDGDGDEGGGATVGDNDGDEGGEGDKGEGKDNAPQAKGKPMAKALFFVVRRKGS